MLPARGWLILLPLLVGCASDAAQPEVVWGRRGLQAGELIRPRALACAADGREIFVVDFAGRVQVYSPDGELRRGWTTPDIANGRPAGITVHPDGSVVIADSHYQRLLIYTPQGELLREITGDPRGAPGRFAYIGDVACDESGYFYVSEFADDSHRIRKLAPTGQQVLVWGSQGTEPGQLARPRGLLFHRGELYVADTCNHRIQVFSAEGSWKRSWGTPGSAPGELRYPYDVTSGPDGLIYVVEYGNHRVQRFTSAGESRGCWGSPGRLPGQLGAPWGGIVDPAGRVFVADTENHRIQRFRF